MGERHEFNGIAFVWNAEKARANRAKHGVSFEQAAEAFFDPFLRVIDASANDEARDAILGMDERWRLLFVVHIQVVDDTIRTIRPAEPSQVSERSMKVEALKKRLSRDRPMTSVTIRMPEDVVDDLKELAPVLGFSGYQPLIRAYVGQGLREDLKRLEKDKLSALVSNLKKRGVSAKLISEALNEAESEGAA